MPKLNRPVIRAAMIRKRMKRADLAARTGIEPKTLTNAIGANHHHIDATKIGAICDVLGLEYEDVIADVEDAPDADAPAGPAVTDQATTDDPAPTSAAAAAAAEAMRRAS